MQRKHLIGKRGLCLAVVAVLLFAGLLMAACSEGTLLAPLELPKNVPSVADNPPEANDPPEETVIEEPPVVNKPPEEPPVAGNPSETDNPPEEAVIEEPPVAENPPEEAIIEEPPVVDNPPDKPDLYSETDFIRSPEELQTILKRELAKERPLSERENEVYGRLVIVEVQTIDKEFERGFISPKGEPQASVVRFYLFILVDPQAPEGQQPGYALLCEDVRVGTLFALVKKGDWYKDDPFTNMLRSNLDVYIQKAIDAFNGGYSLYW